MLHGMQTDIMDKYKPYGFAIHVCIDGWSRKVLCLLVTIRSNSYLDVIASYFLETVEKYGGCPVKVYRHFERKTMPWRQSRAFSVTMIMLIFIACPLKIKGFKDSGLSFDVVAQRRG